jgi:hypothetical protein
MREAVANLISHGEHKDVLLFGALEVVKACHKAHPVKARQWLMELAPAIAAAGDFTDGGETSHLPRELSETLSEVAPDLLPAYYQWLCTEETYSHALSAFHVFLRNADLSGEVNQALAKTAVDDESLAILSEMAGKGDSGAQTTLSSLGDLLGLSLPDGIRREETKKEPATAPEAHDERCPSPEDFSPDRITDYLTAANAMYSYRRERCVRQWLQFWTDAGKAVEAFRAIEKEEKRGIELGNYDALFDLALSLYGKAKAYPWLVKAHMTMHGWDQYFASKERATRRWEIVRKYYPDRWFQFIQDTMRSRHGEPWRNLTCYERFVRLVGYCFFMEQSDLAKEVAEQVINSTLELVSPLKLPIPDWVNES